MDQYNYLVIRNVALVGWGLVVILSLVLAFGG